MRKRRRKEGKEIVVTTWQWNGIRGEIKDSVRRGEGNGMHGCVNRAAAVGRTYDGTKKQSTRAKG